MNHPHINPAGYNEATLEAIEFLSHPDLDFGDSTADLDLLQAPELLQQRVSELLDNPPAFIAAQEEAQALRAHLSQVDWSAVAQEFRNRVEVTANFFDPDAEQHRAANA